MIYQEFETHPDLSYYVQLVWMMESEHQKDQSPQSLVMPDGIVEIVFHYGDPWITTVGGDERAITAPWLRYLADGQIYRIRLSPDLFGAWFGMS